MTPRFKGLLAKLRNWGLHYLGLSEIDLMRIAEEAGTRYKLKPRCYARAYSATDPACGRCDLRWECNDCTIVPEPDLTTTEILPCDICDGQFAIELCDATGQVRDWACSSVDCSNTWHTSERRKILAIGLDDHPTGATLDAIRHAMGWSARRTDRELRLPRRTTERVVAMPEKPLNAVVITMLREWLKGRSVG